LRDGIGVQADHKLHFSLADFSNRVYSKQAKKKRVNEMESHLISYHHPIVSSSYVYLKIVFGL